MGPGDYKPTIPSSTEELVNVFEKGRAELRESLAGISDEAMQRIWSLIWAGQKVLEMPKFAVLRGMVINHMIHHRGQLTVYLRLLDCPVPGVYGPSADEAAS